MPTKPPVSVPKLQPKQTPPVQPPSGAPQPSQPPSAEYADELIAAQMGALSQGAQGLPPQAAPPQVQQQFPPQGISEPQPAAQLQPSTREKGEPREPEEMSPQQIQWELQTLEGERRGLEGDKETGEEGRKQQLEKHIKAKQEDVSKKCEAIDQKKLSFFRVISGYVVAFVADFLSAILVVASATPAEGVEIVVDLVLTMGVFPLILGQSYKKGWAYLELVPFLDALPWYTFSVFSTRRAQKKEISELEASELKPLKEQLDAFQEELGNTEKKLSEVDAREDKLQGIVREVSAQQAPGGGLGAGKLALKAGAGKGWFGARVMYGGGETAGLLVSKLGNGITIILFIAAFAYGMTFAMPRAIAAYQSGDAAQSFFVSTEKTTGGLEAIKKEFERSWKKNTQIATGEYIEGGVDKTVKEFVGIQYKPPLLPNPKKLLQNEPAEFSTRLHGFGNKHPMTATTTCALKDRQLFTTTTTAGETKIDRFPGDEQAVTPQQVKDQLSFTEDITCYPKITTCGNYRVTYSTQVDSLRTDAFLQNNFIQKKVLKDRLEAHAKEKQTNLDDEGEVSSAIRSIWPELGNTISISDKGPVKLLLLTEKAPLIGLDPNTNLKLKVGVENSIGGWMRKIDAVSVTIPEGFHVSGGESATGQSLCSAWVQNGRTLTLSTHYLQTIQESLTTVDKSLQKVFPSCHVTIDPGSSAFIVENEPTPATFTASITYSYVIQEGYDLEVLYPNGSRCDLKKTVPGAGGTAASSVKASTGTASPPV